MLYTTYFSKIRDIPVECIKLVITRFPPKWLDMNKFLYMYNMQLLAPSETLRIPTEFALGWKSGGSKPFQRFSEAKAGDIRG